MIAGPEAAAERVAAWLKAQVPALLLVRATATATAYPPPVLVQSYESGPLAVEDFPAILVLPQRLTSLRLVDVTPGGETYSAAYALRVLLWVRGLSHADTSRIRFGYATAAREALLARKQATAQDSTVGDGLFAVDPTSLVEDYSDVMVDEAGRTIAGVYLDVTVTQVEHVDTTPITGTTTEVAVDTLSVPPHPAL